MKQYYMTQVDKHMNEGIKHEHECWLFIRKEFTQLIIVSKHTDSSENVGTKNNEVVWDWLCNQQHQTTETEVLILENKSAVQLFLRNWRTDQLFNKRECNIF
jgi:hypothetical protein